MQYMSSYRLVADIGGTNTRFALAKDTVPELQSLRVVKTAGFATLCDAIQAYLQDVGTPIPDSACLAIAGPVQGDSVTMTNHPWHFSQAELQHQTGLRKLRLINDFEAVALSIPHLAASGLVKLGGGAPITSKPKIVLGPGTGLGAALLIPTDSGFMAIPTEGGHAALGPDNELELDIFRWLLRQGKNITREQLLSGIGLETLHQAMCALHNKCSQYQTAADIQGAAVAGQDEICEATLKLFCTLLGSAAADQAFSCGAQGGVYLAGGIVSRFIPFLKTSQFRERFEAQSVMKDYLKAVPTYVITAPNPGLLGAAVVPLN